MTTLTQELEALLFLAVDALSVAEIATALNCAAPQVPQILAELKAHLVESGLAIVEINDTYQLTTAPAVAPLVNKLSTETSEDLSPAAAETLAIVAYRGPLLRVDIDAIRGVDSTRSLRQLRIRGLVDQARSSGRYYYTVTPYFLEQLGITRLEQLPKYATLAGADHSTTTVVSPNK